MDEILHHFKTTLFVGIYRGIDSFYGFSGAGEMGFRHPPHPKPTCALLAARGCWAAAAPAPPPRPPNPSPPRKKAADGTEPRSHGKAREGDGLMG